MHGAPDWGVMAGKQTVYALHDMAELAARMGSIDTFDRRGDVVHLEDFEAGGKRYLYYSGGVTSDPVTSVATAKTGAISAKMTTQAEPPYYCTLHAYHPLPRLTGIGFEAAFTLEADHHFVKISLDHYNGADDYYAEVRYDLVDKALYVRHSDGALKTIASGLALFPYYKAWHVIKLVADYKTGKYQRVILDDKQYDLSAYSLYRVGATALVYLLNSIDFYAPGETQLVSYVDDVIITQNEP